MDKQEDLQQTDDFSMQSQDQFNDQALSLDESSSYNHEPVDLSQQDNIQSYGGQQDVHMQNQDYGQTPMGNSGF